MGLALILFGIIFLALPLTHKIKPEWGEPPRAVSPGSEELQVGKRVCIVGIATEHEPAVPSPLDADERILWCHAVVNKYPGFQAGRGPRPTRTLKASTWFRLVDPDMPENQVLIDGHQLSSSMVTLDHDPDAHAKDQENQPSSSESNPLMDLFDLFVDVSRSMTAANIKVIRPGDRLWIRGRLRQGSNGLYLGRWSSVDNVDPQHDHPRKLSNARLVAGIAGSVLVLAGTWKLLL